MLGEKANRLLSRFEKEAHYLANQPGQQRAQLHPDFFQAGTHRFACSGQSLGNRPNYGPDHDTRSQHNGRQRHAIFIEDLPVLFSERHGGFSLPYFSLHTLLIFFQRLYLNFGGFFVRRRGVRIFYYLLRF